tara:strand:- start:7 stop:720 length:714 start_codon:yes stop_codon:yes gene_type:complete
MKTSKPIAIITGASTGIGKQISIKLSDNNYHVLLVSRKKSKLQEVEKQIKKDGNDCTSFSIDVSNEDEINQLQSYVDNNHIDVLINNAGIGIFNGIQNISEQEWDQQINTNLKGAFLMTKLVVDTMIRKKMGKIVFINSVAGLNPYPFSSAYVASKYGLRGFSASLREELREHNIKVISIHPGAINTPFWDNVKADFSKEDMLSPEDVANTTLNAILAKDNIVHEEIIIRRTAGDMK